MVGSISVGIPGQISGLWRVHKEHGRLPWKDLFQESITLCEEGSRISKTLAFEIHEWKEFITNSSFNFGSLLTTMMSSLADVITFLTVFC